MLVLPAFNGMSALAFIDPFRAANYLQGEKLYDWEYLSLEKEEVMASNCLVVGDCTPFDKVKSQFDLLVINASWTPEKFSNSTLQTHLRIHANKGTTLVGIDTGAFVMASAGLMKGYHAAVHYEHIASFTESYPKTIAESVLYVIDRNRLTCCGGIASVDLALEIIRQQQSPDLAIAAAQYIFSDSPRPGNTEQFKVGNERIGQTIPATLRETILLMETNLEEPLRLSKISEYTNTSLRKLERMFHKYTGSTPIGYYISVRLNHAHSLITQTDLSVAEIAGACGFSSSEQFGRAYKKKFNIVPSKDRSRGRVPFQYRSFPAYASLNKD